MPQRPNNYAFIDSQNLSQAIKRQGWTLDYKRFRKYLADKHQVRKAYLFQGYLKENRKFYLDLRNFGYKLIFKPVIRDKGGRLKGNADAELVLQAVANIKHYEGAVIVSGDGDFHCLVKHLIRRNKMKELIIPDSKRYSHLLKEPYIKNIETTFMNGLKTKLNI